MADVFNRTSVFGGAVSADATKISFSGAPSGLIVQNLQIGYSQQISRLYALEDGKVYFIVGRTDGSMQATHVVGPSGLPQAFYASFSDACNPGALVIGFNGGCGTSSSYGALELENVVITNMQFSVDNQSMTIANTLQAMFVSLTISSETEAAAA
jgi:hypothetical protein